MEVEQHVRLYTKYIHEDLLSIDVDTSTYKDHLHKIFEWLWCIILTKEHHSIFLRWEDIPPDEREKKGMMRDMGIDAWDMKGNRVVQMKCYNGLISWRCISTFLACCSLQFKDAVKMLCRTLESSLHPLIQGGITNGDILDKTISDHVFRTECRRIQSLSFPSVTSTETLTIRPYQEQAIYFMEKGQETTKNVYLSIPTGCGKTFIILQYHQRHIAEKMLVLVPTIVLLEQWGTECKKMGIHSFLIGTGHHHSLDELTDETIVICVYNSIVNIHTKLDLFESYIVDEAHHVKTPERYMDNEVEFRDSDDEFEEEFGEDDEKEFEDDEDEEEFEEEFEEEEKEEKEDIKEQKPYPSYIRALSETKKTVYISATLDNPEDDSLYYEYSVRQAITDGYLVDYQFVFPIFEQDDVSNVQLAYYLVYKQHETHCIVYASSCEEGKKFQEQLNRLRPGCAGYIDADTSSSERKRLFKAFKDGLILFLVNVRVLVEGFNATHCRSIFFLHVSSNEVFVIQAIGRALRLHPDKTLATIYVPYTSENDLDRIQSFLAHLSTYDERIKTSMDTKSIGGYIRLEKMEEMEDDDEDEKKEETLCGHRYNLVADSMGKSDKFEEIAIKRALEYKTFYIENGRKPKSCLKTKTKTKEQKENVLFINENRLAMWFQHLKQIKKRRYIYPSVEFIMIELFGEKWYENQREVIAMEKAMNFKLFYITHGRKPSLVLSGKSKDEKNKASKSKKEEHALATWFTVIKKNIPKKHLIYPSILVLLEQLLGKLWYEKDNLEELALIRANSFKKFYTKYNRIPSSVLQGKSKDEKETSNEAEKLEHSLAIYFQTMKCIKRGVNSMRSILYSSVEDIFINLLGETWYEREEKEQKALQKANDFKKFYTKYNRIPSAVLQGKSKDEKETANDAEKLEHALATWFGDMKKSKKSDRGRNRTLYLCVEEVLSKILGNKWYENSLEPNSLLRAKAYIDFYATYDRKPCLKLQGKSKDIKEKASDNEKQEHELAKWFGRIKNSKNGKGTCVLYESVEKMLIEKFGHDWFI